jgi:hypothetical protein
MSTLDVSSFTLSGTFYAYSNPNLTSITFSGSGNTSSDFRIQACNLSTLDVSSFTLSGLFYAYSNSNLTSITFSSSGNTNNNFLVQNCNLSTLDVSSFTFSSLFIAFSNPNLTSITFSSSGNISINFQVQLCNLSTLDVSGFTISGRFLAYSNSNLSSIIWSASPITTGLSELRADDCDLPQAEVDEIFAFIEDFFAVNTPIKDLLTETDGGTNAAPSATGDSDITATEGYFTTAGYTFTANTN